MAYKIPIPILGLDDIWRFWKYVDRKEPDQCWNWTGSCHGNIDDWRCRPTFKIKYQSFIAARISYYIHYNKDPRELLVCHSCSPPTPTSRQLCVNPHHLWLGTYKENLQHAADNGLLSNRNNSNLLDDDIRKIRELKLFGLTYREIGDRYNLGKKQIYRIVKREAFAEVI